MSDVSPVGLLHRLLNGPETDVVPLGDFDKVLKNRGVFRAELEEKIKIKIIIKKKSATLIYS